MRSLQQAYVGRRRRAGLRASGPRKRRSRNHINSQAPSWRLDTPPSPFPRTGLDDSLRAPPPAGQLLILQQYYNAMRCPQTRDKTSGRRAGDPAGPPPVWNIRLSNSAPSSPPPPPRPRPRQSRQRKTNGENVAHYCRLPQIPAL